MGLYSRALRHIDMNRVKELHEEKIMQKKIADEIREQIREELKHCNSPEFSNWRLNLDEMMTTSDVFYTTLPATGDTDLDTADAPTEFTGDIISGHNFTVSRNTTISIDYSKYDTVVVDIATGGGASYWSDNTAGNFLPNVYAFFYAVNDGGTVIASNGDAQGGYPRTSPPFGTLSTNDTLLSSGTNIIPIPPDLRRGNLKLLVYQNANTDSNIVGGVTPNTTFNSITLRRRSPLSVFVPLDDPEATSFIRTGSGNLSPGEKLERLKDMLKASDDYLQKMYGSDFPGTGVVSPGESRFTQQELSDIDKQIQDLQIQSEKNKQDAVINKWKAAAELGLGVAGVVGVVGVAAKIPAAIRAAKTVSQVRQATKAYNTHKALEAIRKAADVKRMTTPGKYTGTPGPGGTTPKGGGMYKS